MADDSWDVDLNMDFHSCDKPHGMKNYILTDLSPEQQTKLNELKRDQIRKDQKYLAAHPEIRGIMVMILRMLMKHRPKTNIQEFIGMYFAQPCIDIQEDVINYLKERDKILSEGSFVFHIDEKSVDEEEKDVEEEESEEKEVQEWAEDLATKDDKCTEDESDETKLEILQKLPEIVEEMLEIVEEDTGSSHKICQEIMNEIIDLVIDEIEIPSLESFVEERLVDYDDHAFGSGESLLENNDSDDDD